MVNALPDRKSLPTRGYKGSPLIWTQEKKARDAELWGCDSSNYWIIQNKLYDLSSFVDKHPGGKSWLTMTKGHDITDHFIVHHLNEDKARQILKKYYVGETKNKVSRFSYDQSGFYRTIKRMVLEKMTPEEIQDSTKTKFHAIIILALYLITLALTAASINPENPTCYPYLFATLNALTIVGAVAMGHNFIHHQTNLFKFYLLLAGFVPDQYQKTHAISHHIYPNTQLDYQLGIYEPFAYFLRTFPPNKWYSEIILLAIFFFSQPINLFVKIILVPITKRKRPQFLYFFPLFVLSLFYFSSGSFLYAFKLHVFLYGVFVLMFTRSAFCSHRVTDVWTEGAERIEDFGEHTIYTCSDTDVWATGLWSYFWTGGFSIHTAHHLFPTADLAALPKILKIVEELCKKRGITMRRKSRLECFISLSKAMTKRYPFERN